MNTPFVGLVDQLPDGRTMHIEREEQVEGRPVFHGTIRDAEGRALKTVILRVVSHERFVETKRRAAIYAQGSCRF